jgi:hypothetical protein
VPARDSAAAVTLAVQLAAAPRFELKDTPAALYRAQTCSWPAAPAAALLASRLSVSNSMSSGSVSGLVERTGFVTLGCSTACSF